MSRALILPVLFIFFAADFAQAQTDKKFTADFEGFFRNRYEYFVNSAYAGFSGKAEKGRTAEKKQKNLRKFKTWKEKFLFLN